MVARFHGDGVDQPLTLDPYTFVNTVLGWMLQDRPIESDRGADGKITRLGQRDLLGMLEGDQTADGQISDKLIAEAYADEGGDPMTGRPMHPLRIKMLEELRRAKDPRAKMEIKARYANHAAALAESEAGVVAGSGDG